MKAKGIFEEIGLRPISINKATMDLLLKQDEPLGLIGLYSFYYYTAIWQKTNQPKSTTDYSAKGLKISSRRIRRYKSKLIKLGLIEDVIRRTKDNSKIKGYFIKVNYYKSYPVQNVQGRKTYRVEKSQGNTYSNSSLNSYKDNTVASKLGDLEISKDCYKKYAIRLATLLQKKYRIRKPNINEWAKQFRLLNTRDDIKKKDIRESLSWYKKNVGLEFVPEILCAGSFRQKFNKLTAAIKKSDKLVEKGEKPTVYHRIKRNAIVIGKKR